MIGDGLVDVQSALGVHKNSDKQLDFKKRHTWVVYEATHLDLLSNLKVYLKIKTWLAK